MAYKIILCDDSPDDAEYVAALVRNWSAQSGVPVRIQTFPSAEAFLFHYAGDNSCDILLLDVEMKNMSGIELAKELRRGEGGNRGSRRMEIVFITSHSEFWDAGYEVDALHYLTKPVAQEKLSAVLDRAAEKLSAEVPSVILSCDGETVRLPEDEILYVESSLHYITIHTPEKAYTIKENISAFEKKLSGGFFRVHRSYLASLRHIIRISRTAVTLRGNVELPLARGNYDAVNRAYIEFN